MKRVGNRMTRSVASNCQAMSAGQGECLPMDQTNSGIVVGVACAMRSAFMLSYKRMLLYLP